MARRTVVLLSVLIGLSSSFAFAADEFTEIAKTDKFTYYLVNDGKVRKGDKVKAWVLQDFIDPQPHPYLDFYKSIIYQAEYDCTARESRTLFLVRYFDHMRTGKVTEKVSSPEALYEPHVPGTIGDELRSAVCRSSDSTPARGNAR